MDHSSRQSPEHEVSAQSERHLLLPLPAGRLSLWWWLVLAAAAAFVLARGVLSFFWLFALPLAYLFLGSAIAAALAPPITWLARWLPRAAAVILLYFFILATLFVIGWLIVPEAFEQIQEFIVEIPELVAPIQEWLNRNDQLDGTAILDTLTTTLTGLSSQLLLLPLTVFSAVVDAVLVLFLSLYTLLDAPRMKTFVFSLVPEGRRIQIQRVIDDMIEAIGGYLRGVFISALIIGILTSIGLWLIGLEFALALGVLAGFFEIIPLVGPILAGIIIVTVTLLQAPSRVLGVLLFVLILQQLESNIIFPNIIGRETETSPLLNLIAFFAGFTVGGIIGALVAVPLAAALRVFVMELVAPVLRRWTGVTS